MKSEWLPRARQRGLIVKKVDGELLVYDVDRHRAHTLPPLMAALWRRCDGRTSPSAMAARLTDDQGAALDEELVAVGLERLRQAHLLRDDEAATATVARRAPASTRRQWLRQAAALGLAVVSITVPTLAEAASAISDADCAKRNPTNCSLAPCRQNPGNVCRRTFVMGVAKCSCTTN